MALCLANSLIACQGCNLYDQLVRYKWWHRYGYMSSTGQCFDIGAATNQSLDEFERRQQDFASKHQISLEHMDYLSDPRLLEQFNVYCSGDGVAGNGSLMRLAPVPLFFYRHPPTGVKYSGDSGRVTHGDQKAVDTCRYYGALIIAALHDYSKEQLLDDQFYQKHQSWFVDKELHPDILEISRGSYKKRGGYDDGIRGKGYVVPALEAALWSFWSTKTFEEGALAAVNLGDDTDTTAAIYGQLAGAYYGLQKLPRDWLGEIYAQQFILTISEWLVVEGERCYSINFPLIPSQQEDEEEERYELKPIIREPSPLAMILGTSLTNIDDEITRKSSRASFHSYNDVLHWSKENVFDWFRSLGEKYEGCAKFFRDKGVDGTYLLLSIDDQILRRFGITDPNHRVSILQRIDWLKFNVSGNFYNEFKDDEFNEIPHMLNLGKTANDTRNLSEKEKRGRGRLYKNIVQELPERLNYDNIVFINNEDRYRIFLQQIMSAEHQKREHNQRFTGDRQTPDEERKMFGRLNKLTRQVHHHWQVSIVRGWFTCSRAEGQRIEDKRKSIRETIYLKSSARYAAEIVDENETNECLVMCYAIIRDPYPVILQNGSPARYRFYSKGTPDQSNSSSESRRTIDFGRKPEEIEDGIYDEFVSDVPDDISYQVVIYLKPK